MGTHITAASTVSRYCESYLTRADLRQGGSGHLRGASWGPRGTKRAHRASPSPLRWIGFELVCDLEA